jgi:hypothetical protein
MTTVRRVTDIISAKQFGAASRAPHSAFGFPATGDYSVGVKIILLCVLAIASSSFTGCASRKPKSSVRMYEGDSSPGIKMFEEKPGYPLNTR